MTIRLLAFGIAKDIMGGSAADIAVGEQPTVLNLKNALEQRYPELRRLKSFLIAINNEYAPDSRHIQPTDEVAIIPPVSGG